MSLPPTSGKGCLIMSSPTDMACSSRVAAHCATKANQYIIGYLRYGLHWWGTPVSSTRKLILSSSSHRLGMTPGCCWGVTPQYTKPKLVSAVNGPWNQLATTQTQKGENRRISRQGSCCSMWNFRHMASVWRCYGNSSRNPVTRAHKSNWEILARRYNEHRHIGHSWPVTGVKDVHAWLTWLFRATPDWLLNT